MGSVQALPFLSSLFISAALLFHWLHPQAGDGAGAAVLDVPADIAMLQGTEGMPLVVCHVLSPHSDTRHRESEGFAYTI